MIEQQPTEADLEAAKAIADAMNVTMQLEQSQQNPSPQCATPADTFRSRTEFLLGNE